MANISKIKLPDKDNPYDIIDKSALHSSDIDTTVTNESNTKVASAGAVKKAYDTANAARKEVLNLQNNLNINKYNFLTYKKNTYTEAQIKALTLARVGDFYIASDTNAAWICVTVISGAASESSWEKIDSGSGAGVDMSKFVTAYDTTGSTTDTMPPTFDGKTIDKFVLKDSIVNNLTSTSIDVPLSAAQGKILDDKIDQVQQTANNSVPKSGGALTGELVAQSNSNYTTKQVRNIILSTSDPNSSDGDNGDIWIKYSI